MPRYRRLRPMGGTYFFTLRLSPAAGSLLTDRIEALRWACAKTISDAPVRWDAVVVLPDHLHMVWTLPPEDNAYSERIRKIKFRFSQAIGHRLPRSESKIVKRETGIWQRRFWEHVIRNTADYRNHVAYCWGNPVKHGLVARPVQWPHSSLHRDIRLGRVEPEWEGVEHAGRFGE